MELELQELPVGHAMHGVSTAYWSWYVPGGQVPGGWFAAVQNYPGMMTVQIVAPAAE